MTVVLVSILLNHSFRPSPIPSNISTFGTFGIYKRGSLTSESDHFGLRCEITQLLFLPKREHHEFNSMQRRVTRVDFGAKTVEFPFSVMFWADA